MRRVASTLLPCALALIASGQAFAHHAPAGLGAGAVAAPAMSGPTVTRSGVVEVVHGDGRGGAESLRAVFLRTQRGRLSLQLPRGLDVRPGERTRVRGRFAGATLVVDRVTRLASRRLQAATGPRSVAVILVNFQDDTSQPWTPAQIESAMFSSPTSVANYYAEQSFGQLAVSGAVHGWVTIPYSRASCDFFSWYSAAVSAVGYGALGNPTNVMLVFPYTPACNWAGLATLGAGYSWINGSVTLRTMAHELGHNFGADHARTWNCTQSGSRVWLSANCSLHSEYGDPFSTMGAATTRHFNGLHKAQLGWVTGPSFVAPTAGGTFTLTPLGSPSSGVQVLKLPRSSSEAIYVDLRKAAGSFETYTAGSAAVSGVMLRLGSPASYDWNSRLLDTTPVTATFDDAPLLAGRTVTDPVSGVSITTLAVDATSATVSVTIPDDTSPPSTPSVFTTLLPDGTVQVAWTASSDDRGLAHYAVLRDGAPVAAAASGTWLTDTAVAALPGTHAYVVVAVDLGGNSSAPSAPSLVTVPDRQAPTPPAALTAALTEDGVQIAWSAASDDVGVVEYAVVRDGVELGRTDELEWIDDEQGEGNVTYAVQAFDEAGNASAPIVAGFDLANGLAEGDDLEGEDGFDVSPPSTVRRLRARPAGKRTVELTWKAARDDVGVESYLIARNGKVIARTRALRARVPVTRSAPVQLSVLAVDESGNIGRPAKLRLTPLRSR